jgi:hypothetical protein
MGHVLKAQRVRLEEPLRLSIGGPAAPEHACANRPGAQSRVRLVENNAQGATLEVTCACGGVIQVRCEYGATDAPPAPQGHAQP